MVKINELTQYDARRLRSAKNGQKPVGWERTNTSITEPNSHNVKQPFFTYQRILPAKWLMTNKFRGNDDVVEKVFCSSTELESRRY